MPKVRKAKICSLESRLGCTTAMTPKATKAMSISLERRSGITRVAIRAKMIKTMAVSIFDVFLRGCMDCVLARAAGAPCSANARRPVIVLFFLFLKISQKSTEVSRDARSRISTTLVLRPQFVPVPCLSPPSCCTAESMGIVLIF